MLPRAPLARAVEAFKALGHPARLRIVEMLGSGPLSVCQITAVLGLAPSTISAHLSELSYAGIVEHERRGRFLIYHLAGGETDRILADVRPLLATDTQVMEDHDRSNRLRSRGIDAVDWAAPCIERETGPESEEPVLVGAIQGDEP